MTNCLVPLEETESISLLCLAKPRRCSRVPALSHVMFTLGVKRILLFEGTKSWRFLEVTCWGWPWLFLPAGGKGRAVFGDIFWGAPASCQLSAFPRGFPRRKKETRVGSWIGFMLLLWYRLGEAAESTAPSLLRAFPRICSR